MKRILSAVAAVAILVSMGVGTAEARNRTVVNQWGWANGAAAAQHGDRNGTVNIDEHLCSGFCSVGSPDFSAVDSVIGKKNEISRMNRRRL